ncbi:MAG: MFS transporter [Nitriliruptorales bacterium]|nr:MFS transporter [Nitriliruptorales bacterium]
MNASLAALLARAVGYFALGHFVPFYAVYALLLAEQGMSRAAISSLFAVWSVTSFVLEVPSGAWADVMSRRALLVVSALLTAAGLSAWTVGDTYAVYAAGFVLCGAGSAVMSGTFEALLYDELVVRKATARYAGVLGWANAIGMALTLCATFAATPLLRLGGFAAVGWVSVAVALLQAGFAVSLPRTARAARAQEDAATTNNDVDTARELAGAAVRYVAVLRAGVAEVTRDPVVRRVVLTVAVLVGALDIDEYFPFVAREAGTAVADVPLLLVTVGVAQTLGTALAGMAARLRARALTVMTGVAGLLLGVGAVSGHPAGFAAIAVGYGVLVNVAIVMEARLQDAMEGSARATVTSVAGLATEAMSIGLFSILAFGSMALPTGLLVALVGAAIVLLSPHDVPTTSAEQAHATSMRVGLREQRAAVELLCHAGPRPRRRRRHTRPHKRSLLSRRLDDEDEIPGLDVGARVHRDSLHFPGDGGGDGRLHLHRLDRGDTVPPGDRVAFGDGNVDHACQRCGHVAGSTWVCLFRWRRVRLDGTVARIDGSGLTVQRAEDRADAVLVGVGDRFQLDEQPHPPLEVHLELRARLQAVQKRSGRQGRHVAETFPRVRVRGGRLRKEDPAERVPPVGSGRGQVTALLVGQGGIGQFVRQVPECLGTEGFRPAAGRCSQGPLEEFDHGGGKVVARGILDEGIRVDL